MGPDCRGRVLWRVRFHVEHLGGASMKAVLVMLAALWVTGVVMTIGCSSHGHRADWNSRHVPTAPATPPVDTCDGRGHGHRR